METQTAKMKPTGWSFCTQCFRCKRKVKKHSIYEVETHGDLESQNKKPELNPSLVGTKTVKKIASKNESEQEQDKMVLNKLN